MSATLLLIVNGFHEFIRKFYQLICEDNQFINFPGAQGINFSSPADDLLTTRSYRSACHFQTRHPRNFEKILGIGNRYFQRTSSPPIFLDAKIFF